MGEKGEAEAVQRSVKQLEDMSKGVGCHEIEAIALQGLQILQSRRGFISCNFIVSPPVSDKDGNWHVGAMTTLIDDVGAAAICSAAGHFKASLDITISYFSTAKIHEEVVIEAKVMGDKGKLTSVMVEVRRKQNGELIALAKQWMASNNNAVSSILVNYDGSHVIFTSILFFVS